MVCYIWYSEEGTGRGRSPSSPLLAVPNVTDHPSTASVPITVLQYNGPLLCSFNVGIKGLICADYTADLIYALNVAQHNNQLHKSNEHRLDRREEITVRGHKLETA